MELKRWHKDYYPTLSKWWKARSWFVCPLDMLSSSGLIAFNEGEPVAAGFIYYGMGSKTALMDWFIADPNTTKKERNEATQRIVEAFEVEAKANGYKYLISTTDNAKWANKLKAKHGYSVNPNPHCLLSKSLHNTNIDFLED